MPLSLETTEAASPDDFTMVGGRMELPRRLDTKRAPLLLAELKKHRCTEVRLACEHVELLGMQCAVVLASAAKTWRADDSSLVPEAPSTGFLRDLDLLGLDLKDISAP